jgi:hypothetical protein
MRFSGNEIRIGSAAGSAGPGRVGAGKIRRFFFGDGPAVGTVAPAPLAISMPLALTTMEAPPALLNMIPSGSGVGAAISRGRDATSGTQNRPRGF